MLAEQGVAEAAAEAAEGTSSVVKSGAGARAVVAGRDLWASSCQEIVLILFMINRDPSPIPFEWLFHIYFILLTYTKNS